MPFLTLEIIIPFFRGEAIACLCEVAYYESRRNEVVQVVSVDATHVETWLITSS